MEKKDNVLMICGAQEVPIIEESTKTLKQYDVETEPDKKIWNMGSKKYLNEMIKLLMQDPDRYKGVVGTRDATSVYANAIAEKTGKPGTSMESIINTQNKYLARKIQQQVVPDNIPRFWLDSEMLRQFPIDPPFFVKPVRGNMSYASQKVNSYDELREIIKDTSQELTYYNRYFLEALHVTSHLRNQDNLDTCNKFLCEELVQGTQITVNGYVYEGDIRIYGIVKAAFWDRGISFSHHEFPHALPEHLEQQVRDVVHKVVPALGLNNTFFNIELRVDEENDKVYIIEVNSRMAFQFAKMIESVTGINLVKSLCDLATGKKPDESGVEIEKTFNYCFNFELREFSDRNIVRVPTDTDLNKLKEVYPEVTVKNLVAADTRLSDYKQNVESFRYCILDVPGNSREEIIEKYRDIRRRLGYEFQDGLRPAT